MLTIFSSCWWDWRTCEINWDANIFKVASSSVFICYISCTATNCQQNMLHLTYFAIISHNIFTICDVTKEKLFSKYLLYKQPFCIICYMCTSMTTEINWKGISFISSIYVVCQWEYSDDLLQKIIYVYVYRWSWRIIWLAVMLKFQLADNW